jgi:hypothetical protein
VHHQFKVKRLIESFQFRLRISACRGGALFFYSTFWQIIVCRMENVDTRVTSSLSLSNQHVSNNAPSGRREVGPHVMSIMYKFLQYKPTRLKKSSQQQKYRWLCWTFVRCVPLRMYPPSTLHMSTWHATWQHKIIDYLFKPTLHMQILITWVLCVQLGTRGRNANINCKMANW